MKVSALVLLVFTTTNFNAFAFDSEGENESSCGQSSFSQSLSPVFSPVQSILGPLVGATRSPCEENQCDECEKKKRKRRRRRRRRRKKNRIKFIINDPEQPNDTHELQTLQQHNNNNNQQQQQDDESDESVSPMKMETKLESLPAPSPVASPPSLSPLATAAVPLPPTIPFAFPFPQFFGPGPGYYLSHNHEPPTTTTTTTSTTTTTTPPPPPPQPMMQPLQHVQYSVSPHQMSLFGHPWMAPVFMPENIPESLPETNWFMRK